MAISKRLKKYTVDIPRENNLEYDLYHATEIQAKVKESHIYAQHLYTALSSKEFQRLEVMLILKNQKWSCSSLTAHNIVSRLQCKREDAAIQNFIKIEQDQLDEYEWNDLTFEEQLKIKEKEAYVFPGVITDEIAEDLRKINWVVG